MTYIYSLLNILETNYVWYSIIVIAIGLIAFTATKNSIAFWITTIALIIIGFIDSIYPLWFMLLTGFASITFMIYQKSPSIWRI
jgi:hypothetical protein